jgi:hypothetical protein
MFSRLFFAPRAGTRFDTTLTGRAGSTGCVTSGRHWHHVFRLQYHRFGAAFSKRQKEA